MHRTKSPGDGPTSNDGFTQHAEDVVRNTVGLSTALGAAAEDVRLFVTECTTEKPLMTLAVAATVGYVLGGGPKMRLLSLFFSLGTSIGARLAVASLAREASRNMPSAAA